MFSGPAGDPALADTLTYDADAAAEMFECPPPATPVKQQHWCPAPLVRANAMQEVSNHERQETEAASKGPEPVCIPREEPLPPTVQAVECQDKEPPQPDGDEKALESTSAPPLPPTSSELKSVLEFEAPCV